MVSPGPGSGAGLDPIACPPAHREGSAPGKELAGEPDRDRAFADRCSGPFHRAATDVAGAGGVGRSAVFSSRGAPLQTVSVVARYGWRSAVADCGQRHDGAGEREQRGDAKRVVEAVQVGGLGWIADAERAGYAG